MKTVAILATLDALNRLFSRMPEPVKRLLDGELDKLEDKNKPGSLADDVIEAATAVLRGKWNISEYEEKEVPVAATPKKEKPADAEDKPKSTKVIPKGFKRKNKKYNK